MSKYYEQTHSHRGNSVDGSPQIEYKNIINVPDPPYIPTIIYSQLASNQTIANATETVINFTTGGFSSGVYTIPEDGIYLIRFRTLPSSSSPTTGNYRSIRLYIGSTIKDISTISTVKYTVHEVELYADLSKNDTVSAKFIHDAGSNVTLASEVNTIANIIRLT